MKKMVAVVAVSLLGLAACSSTNTSGSPAVPGEAKPAANELLAKAPVADAAAILPGSTMEKIKKRGELIVGGSLDAPLLSQQNRSAARSRASTPTWARRWRSTSSASRR